MKWEKYGAPVFGGKYGTCFDVSMMIENGEILMYVSWRDQKSIALIKSIDGIKWSEPMICLEPRATAQGWEDDLNRPSVVKRDGVYHMWYTGQYHRTGREGTSHIFHAISEDGVSFHRTGDVPVLVPDLEWEDTSVMNPSVIWDDAAQVYKMWYCAGAQHEPRAIGFARSADGIVWEKYGDAPVFEADPSNEWEQFKTAGCQVIKREKDYLLFYIGYVNEEFAQIGMAKSPDGLGDWLRYPGNPIVSPSEGWDGDACYKPFVMPHEGKWKLWYNGRKGFVEQIGLAIWNAPELDF